MEARRWLAAERRAPGRGCDPRADQRVRRRADRPAPRKLSRDFARGGDRPAGGHLPCLSRPALRLGLRQPDRYQVIGGGGLAVMLTGFPGPDIVAVRTGPNRPHPPNGGTVTSVLIPKPPVDSAFTGSLMLNGSAIG